MTSMRPDPAAGTSGTPDVAGTPGIPGTVNAERERQPAKAPADSAPPRRLPPRTLPRPVAPPLVDDPIGDPPSAVSAWNIANALTVGRIVLVPLFVLALFHDGGHEAIWRIAAGVVFAIACVTDRVDGELARKRNIVTEFGKLADPIADKALVGAALIGLSVLRDLPWWITAVVLARELGVTLLRFWVIRHGVIPASRGGKLKTLLQAVAIGLYVLPLSGWLHVVAEVIMYAAVIVALVTGFDYVARAVRLRRDSDRESVPAADR